MKYSETKVYKIAKESLKIAEKTVPPYSSKYSKKTYTQHQHIAVLFAMTKIGKDLRETEEALCNMPYLCDMIGLESVQDFTTICRKRKQLSAKFFLVMLYLSASLIPNSGKASIDATGFDRRHSSKHYAKRCRIRIKSMKTTLIIDTETLAILGFHATASRKHDSKIVVPLVRTVKKKFRIDVLPADKGYDGREVRRLLKAMGIRPLIKHRVYGYMQEIWNNRMKNEDYHRRSLSETVNSMLKRNYNDTLYARDYGTQVKELMIMLTVHNIERMLNFIALIFGGLQQSRIFLTFYAKPDYCGRFLTLCI